MPHSGWMVGNPYLGITSGLLVIRAEPGSEARRISMEVQTHKLLTKNDSA